MLKALIIFLAFASNFGFAGSDQLLLKRSSRPMMAEGSIEALRYWETPLEGFFIRTHHNTLPIKIDDSWTISFEGLVKKPQKLTIKSLKRKRQVSFHAVLECSGNGRALFDPPVSGIQWKRGAIGNAEWKGVPVKEIFSALGVGADAKFATFEGFDEPVIPSKAKFVRSIPISLLIETGAILAFEMNREPLPIAHGGPVRLVMPNIYGQNWIKWVNKITLSSEPDTRTYAAKAYRMPTKSIKPGDAWDPVKEGRPVEYIKVQTIFTDPMPGDSVLPGKYILRGKALSGSGSISRVEISSDQGKTWVDAKVTNQKDHSWQEFESTIDVSEGKTYELMARATDSKGNIQPLTQEWNPKGYLYNAADRITFKCSTNEAKTAEGVELTRQHCFTCHSPEIIDQQKLTKPEWISVIKKMSDYGLTLDQESSDKIATSLAENKPGKMLFAQDLAAIDLSARSETIVPPKGRNGIPNKGKILFGKNCAACHGADAQGQSGPRLKGRSISDAAFWTTVKHGRRTMPPFQDRLSNRDIEDIQSWIQR